MEFKDVIAKIITGLENGAFEENADEPAKGDEDFQEAVDVIAGLLGGKQYGKWHLLAAETHIRQMSDHVRVDEIEDYLDENFLLAGSTVADTLENYAASDEVGEIGALYRALDTAGGVDRFDWGSYADDGMTPTIGMQFIQVPAPTGEDSVFLFTSNR
jgi:hypothetical protein